MNTETLPTSIPEINDRIYAGFWRRAGALMLDGLFMLPLSIGSILINNQGRLNYLYTIIPISLFSFIYCTYPVQRWGGTPGKLISGILILKKDGEHAGWKEAVLRYLPLYVLSFFGIIAQVIVLMNMNDSEYISMPFAERSRHMMELMPSWATYTRWANHLWIIIGIIIMMSNERRRAVHDFFAGTVVVKKKYITALNQRTHSIAGSAVSE
jgi:uncharacterized RDD family membrane protein YckC